MEVKADSYRYVNWVLFVGAALANSIPTQAFSSVSPIICEVFGVSQFEATVPSILYPLTYVFMLLPANYILDKRGLKLGTLFCEACMCVGLLLRLLLRVHFYFFYLGTFLCSLGFCFMLSAANQFATRWFPRAQIALANALCVFALFASDALGTFLSAWFIREDATQDSIFAFFLWESVGLIAVHILNALFFRGEPASPQNYASVASRDSYRKDLASLFGNLNYRWLFLSTTFLFGGFSIMFVFMPWVTKCYGYESVSNGLIIISANLAGCAGCVVVGLARTIPYRTKCAVLLAAETVCFVLLWVTFEAGLPWASYCAGGLLGFFGYPFLTTVTDFATQTTFPVGEATAGGTLLFGGQFVGVVMVSVFSFIFDGQSLTLTRLLICILLAMTLSGMVSMLCAKEILKRNDYEDAHQHSGSLISQN